jgi:crotonobetainyl-CoA:carnitine CoA-transferase CaiB-like acyl-CoA transferase
LMKVQPDADLEVGKKYHWFFKVKTVCEANQPPALSYVEGWIQRQAVTSVLGNRLTTATPQQSARLYAEAGIWYDALNTLAEAHFANPNEVSLTQDWTELLRSVGLEQFASQPPVE